MNIRKPLAGVATLWLALAPAAADQSNHWSPTTGTVSGLNLTNNYNGAFASVDSCNSGNSAPTNTLSGAPVEGMCWVDTSTNKLKFYDGASWLVAASFDPTAHIWKPAIGGGAGSIASAPTTDIGAQPETYLSVFGARTINSFGTSAPIGAVKFLEFAGSLTLTNSASLILPTGANIVTQAGDMAIAVNLSPGVFRLGYFPASGLPPIGATPPSAAYLPNFLSGLTLANDAGTPNSLIDISAGVANSSDNSTLMASPAFTKSTAAWAVGTGNGALDTGAVGPSVFYHVYEIERPDTGNVDFLESLSPNDAVAGAAMSIATPSVMTWALHGLQVGSQFSCTTTGAFPAGFISGQTYYVIAAGLTPNSFEYSATQGGSAINTSGMQSGTTFCTSTPMMPVNYTKLRRIGSIRTDANSHIVAFVQHGDEFLWAAPPQDVNATNLGPSPVLYTLSQGLPPGVEVDAFIGLSAFNAVGGTDFFINSPDVPATTPNFNTGLLTLRLATSASYGANPTIRANMGQQIRAVATTAGTNLTVSVFGYSDRRGQ
jgi:hypothetical protein